MKIRTTLASLLLICANGLIAHSASASTESCPSNSGNQIADLHSEWILVGWEKKPGDAPFDFRAKLGKYYDFSAPKVVLYDDFDPTRRVARSADAYGNFWKEPFTQLRSARHSVIDGPDVVMGTDLATSTLEFAAALEAADGKIVGIRTRSTLVWHCKDASWKIVREHNSSTVIEVPEVKALLKSGKSR